MVWAKRTCSQQQTEEGGGQGVSSFYLSLGGMVELCTTGEMWCLIGDTGLSKVCPC